MVRRPTDRPRPSLLLLPRLTSCVMSQIQRKAFARCLLPSLPPYVRVRHASGRDRHDIPGAAEAETGASSFTSLLCSALPWRIELFALLTMMKT